MLIMILILLISCKNTNNLDNNGITINEPNKNSKTIQIYNNRLYYFNGYTVIYKRLDDLSIDAIPLCSDSLCGHNSKSCPLFLGWRFYKILAIDKEESIKNKNYPIIYLSYWSANSESSLDGNYRISRYDSAKNITEVIVSKVPNLITSFYLYEKYVFYITDDGDSGHNIHVITKDGKNKYSLDNPNNNSYIFVAAENDLVYYSDWFGNIYMSDIKLQTSTLLLKTNSTMGTAYIYNGYLYYADDYDVAATMGTTEIMNCNFYKISLDNLNAIPEKIIENVFFSILPYCFVVDNKLYYCQAVPEYIGLGFCYNIDSKKQDFDFYFNGTGTIYSYDMTTGKICVEIENNGFDLLTFYGGDKNYIIYDLYRVQTDLTKPYSNFDDTPLFIYNIINKEKTELKGIYP